MTRIVDYRHLHFVVPAYQTKWHGDPAYTVLMVVKEFQTVYHGFPTPAKKRVAQ